jgi:hypothetical protein
MFRLRHAPGRCARYYPPAEDDTNARTGTLHARWTAKAEHPFISGITCELVGYFPRSAVAERVRFNGQAISADSQIPLLAPMIGAGAYLS